MKTNLPKAMDTTNGIKESYKIHMVISMLMNLKKLLEFEDEPIEPQRFRLQHDADRCAEYVAMGWRETEPQDMGRVFCRTEGNLIKAREILRNSYYLSRRGANVEAVNIYKGQA